MVKLVVICLLICYLSSAYSQGYVDQHAIYPLINNQDIDIADEPGVKWHTYTYTDRLKLQKHLDSLPGSLKIYRRYVIELANRITAEHFTKGKVLVVPDSFKENYKAYAPYPFLYPTASTMPKLFIIDKYTQTFGAYEYGKLVRWGIVSTGRRNNLTPVGRYNFNWKIEYRQSSAAPPGEVWEMYWVFNFHAKFGIHIHQYALPIGMAVSHGCVRTSEADAIWNYNWASGWVLNEKGRLMRNGTPVMIINNSFGSKVSHWGIDKGIIVSLVQLPQTFDEIRLGTKSQREADWESGW